MKKCALHNLGCKVNSYETQAMQQMMTEAGYEIVPFGTEAADVYIINTCSVTNIADQKSRQMIHKARKLNPDAIVVATGCYVESANIANRTDADILIGNNEKSRLVELIEEYTGLVRPINESINSVSCFDEMKIDGPEEHTRAFVKIQDGCNRFCTYCIIPYVRGRIRSRRPDDVLDELTRIAESGCKEVVLTGIHLSSYGMDFSDGITLIDIIEKAQKIEGIERIRLGSLEPLIVTEDFVRRLSACDKVCPHFHLSLQSGCNETLRRMNRRYTTEEYMQGVEILRKYYDNPAITTDVIAGFPMETEEEFSETLDFVKKVGFYEMHVFKYSRRKGTMADAMSGQLTERVKSERSARLIAVNEELSHEYRMKYVGRKVRVLLEEVVNIDGVDYYTGFTDTYVRVHIPAADKVLQTNEIVSVRVICVEKKDIVLGVAEI